MAQSIFDRRKVRSSIAQTAWKGTEAMSTTHNVAWTASMRVPYTDDACCPGIVRQYSTSDLHDVEETCAEIKQVHEGDDPFTQSQNAERTGT
jgi:hypothetical protein